MYALSLPLQFVKGVGPVLAQKFSEQGLATIKDLLLFVPLRYEDRSQRRTIAELQVGELATLEVTVASASNYYKGRKSIQSARVKDETGSLKLMWFNNRFVIDKLEKGSRVLVSGQINDRGMMIQPTVERAGGESIHTDRLVPIYSSTLGLKQGQLRRLLKHILDHLDPIPDQLTTFSGLNLNQTLSQLHFPDEEKLVIQARERLALEELLTLIKHSQQIKENWHQLHQAPTLAIDSLDAKAMAHLIPDSIPFKLTPDQLQATQEILQDLKIATPMNRLLIGDVGSGKTVVAGIAAYHLVLAGYSVALVAPTKILAEQHLQTLSHLFPQLPLQLVTATQGQKTSKPDRQPAQLYIGTHALINRFSQIQPALIIYDEQHRFGVRHRSPQKMGAVSPHVLTMSATPIPRSLMLTIFSHLKLSQIAHLPPGRLPVKTWVVPQAKKPQAYQWLFEQLGKERLAIVVCPFIQTSSIPAFEAVAAATAKYEELTALRPNFKIDLLHGQLNPTVQQQISHKLFAGETQILVTTPVVEVGLDVPHADLVVIESAERFGMASLHQLRGRVGRAGQQAYCLVIPSHKNGDSRRLQHFARENNGFKLAEADLKRRGAGNLFGTEQTGWDNLRFATWTNLQLITQARDIYQHIQDHQIEWQPFLPLPKSDIVPQAN